MQSLVPFYKEHHASSAYGTGGHKKAQRVLAGLSGCNIRSILDWGAGSRTMEKAILQFRPDLKVTSYDPAIPGIDVLPEGPFDATISTDVLEHIPYEEIDSALEQIVGLTKKRGYHYIASGPANLWLPDGRNAHIIQEGSNWWRNKFHKQGVHVISAEDTTSMAGDKVVYRAAIIIFERA